MGAIPASCPGQHFVWEELGLFQFLEVVKAERIQISNNATFWYMLGLALGLVWPHVVWPSYLGGQGATLGLRCVTYSTGSCDAYSLDKQNRFPAASA